MAPSPACPLNRGNPTHTPIFPASPPSNINYPSSEALAKEDPLPTVPGRFPKLLSHSNFPKPSGPIRPNPCKKNLHLPHQRRERIPAPANHSPSIAFVPNRAGSYMGGGSAASASPRLRSSAFSVRCSSVPSAKIFNGAARSRTLDLGAWNLELRTLDFAWVSPPLSSNPLTMHIRLCPSRHKK
jgi:hypothetical protein